ncbi:Fc receptor-like protein 5 [Misgurnus anguillicaudatus]|uniref:Fc receptor-like protein 5 n=1 Tax=Misgurnus anguillicaudatus TaxID=75329 RepID=UPI003CCF5CE9
MSDAVTLTVSSHKRPTVLSVSPDRWLTPGESVTLLCRLRNSSTGWTFSWFTVQKRSSGKIEFISLSVSSGVSKGIYTVSSVTVNHTGVYVCRAERGDPVYYTEYSNTQTLWITGVSPSVSLIIRPNRSQHFSSESLSLSCEDHSTSTGWTVRRYTNTLGTSSSSVRRSTGTTSTCTISDLYTSDTGVYWCQSESGENLHPVNISVHYGNAILDSPVHPVTEGDNLTLRCLYRNKNPSTQRAEFYKDGSVVQTTGDMMIIPKVSKSHEGFYYCKHPERGESPKSWISVRDKPTLTVQPQTSVFIGDTVTLTCEMSQSTGWEFILITPSNTKSTETTGTKTIYVQVSDGGEYKCKARRRENPQVYTQDSEPVTVTVQERPTPQVSVWPDDHVYRGETVNLTCVINGEGVSSWQYSWYKDSSLYNISDLQYYTIRSVTESDTGNYTCRGNETRGSRYSHISDSVTLTVSGSSGHIVGAVVGLFILFLVIFLVLLWWYKNKKGKVSRSPSAVSPQQNISRTSDQKRTEDGFTPLQSGDAHIYDSVDATDNKDASSAVTQAGPSDAMYSQVNFKKNKLKSKDNESDSADITYADIELKPKKEMKKKKKKKGNSSEGGDTVYSKVKIGDKGVASGSVDLTYAQIT